MKDMDTKIVGYGLLILGIVIIAYAAINVIGVFNGSSQPISLFTFPPVKVELIQGTPEVELLPADVLNKSTNLIAHLLFMGFIASVGSKFSSIGTQLVRPIKISLKSEDGKKKEI